MTLDDPDELSLALDSPKGFLEIQPWPLLIEEVQKAPILLNLIKKAIDEERVRRLDSGAKRQIMYVLAGSNRFGLQEGISESLAGRAAIFEMGSLTQMEGIKEKGYLFNPDIQTLLEKERESKIPYANQKEIFERIWRGACLRS